MDEQNLCNLPSTGAFHTPPVSLPTWNFFSPATVGRIFGTTWYPEIHILFILSLSCFMVCVQVTACGVQIGFINRYMVTTFLTHSDTHFTQIVKKMCIYMCFISCMNGVISEPATQDTSIGWPQELDLGLGNNPWWRLCTLLICMFYPTDQMEPLILKSNSSKVISKVQRKWRLDIRVTLHRLKQHNEMMGFDYFVTCKNNTCIWWFLPEPNFIKYKYPPEITRQVSFKIFDFLDIVFKLGCLLKEQGIKMAWRKTF